MRELTIRIRFTRDCLGNVQEKNGRGRFLLPRTPDGHIMFLSTWHTQNMRLAAKLLGRYQNDVDKIFWDVAVDGNPGSLNWYKRYYPGNNGRQRYALHESLRSGSCISINCAVPSTIPDDGIIQLMRLAGRYKGLSPFHPGEFGQFDVESVRPRRHPVVPDTDDLNDVSEGESIENKKAS